MLGENIIAQRKRLGLSQQMLADQLHVVRQTVSKWEKNLSVPDADALLKLADALDTSVQTLLGIPEGSSEPTSSDVVAALTRINDQLAIQNRRRRRIWTVIAWIVGLSIAFYTLMPFFGWLLYSADLETVTETVTVEETVLMDEAE